MRALIVTLGLAACTLGEPGPGIDLDRALAHVTELTAIGPRPGDSAKSREAAAYIEHELTQIGLTVERIEVGDVALPEIVVLGARYREAHHVVTTDPDLVVRFRGPDPDRRALLVMAHYDTVPASPGGIDDGAAVATLIELARVLHDHPPAQPVMLAFTANEEIGLVGAEALADQGRNTVELAIALDLVGGSGRLSLNGASTLIRERELDWLASAGDRAGVAIDAPLPHRVISRWWPQAERADHGAFTRRGIRAFHLYNRGQDGLWIDLAYHSAYDVASRVHRDSLAELGRLLVALANAPVPAESPRDGFWLPLAINVVVPRWCLLALELVLVLVGVLALVLLALDGRGATATRGCGMLAAIACFAVATAIVFAAEHFAAHGRINPWLFTPLRSVVAEVLAFAGVFGLATRVCARIAPWIGTRRYLALAIAMPLVTGVALLATGAAELAWVWLLPAAALALAPRLGRLAPLAIVIAVLPSVLVLRENQLVEAAYNGFLPPGVPLVAWIASLGIPCLAGVGWWVRTRTATGPLVTLILPMGCGLSAVVGLAVLGLTPIACSAAKFEQFPATCARVSTWP